MAGISGAVRFESAIGKQYAGQLHILWLDQLNGAIRTDLEVLGRFRQPRLPPERQ